MHASAHTRLRQLSVAAIGLAAVLGAQDRVPVPGAAARAAVQSELLERLASIMVAQPREDSAIDRLLAAAAESARSPALRYELLQQAMRCAHAASDVAGGLRVATALVEGFAVNGVHEAFLVGVQVGGRVTNQVVAAGCLDAAQQLLERDPAAFAAVLAGARRVCVSDAPPGLRACVESAAADLEAVRAAYQRVRAAPDEQGLALSYRTTYRAEWPDRVEAVGEGTDAVARILRSKITARGEPRDVVALARAGEQWLSRRQQTPDAIAQRNLSRRSMQLLLPMTLIGTRPAGADPAPGPGIEAPEVERVRRLLDLATQQAVAPGVGSLQFAAGSDLDRMLITGGAWRVEQGRLFGRSLGPDVATRATARFAWRRIDCVTFRAGIQSGDGLNLRLAVGNVNALFNWEVADSNHFYFGETLAQTAPRLLQAGREYAIQLRQLDDQVVVCLDGHPVATGSGRLAGTVTVYPALGSEIFVSSIEIVGDVDLGTVVTGPGAAR